MDIIYRQSENYIRKETVKRWIMIHWMAGTLGGTEATLQFPKVKNKVNVPFNIGRDGRIYQYFDWKYWAYHTGRNAYGKWCEQSIGIEVEAWGQLTKKDGRFYNWVNREVPADEVIELAEFRGFRYFHALTDAQNESLLWLSKHLSGECPTLEGVKTHAMVHPQKVDYPPDYPLPQIILCTNPEA